MTVEQGRQAYLAYGSLTDTIQTLRVLARGHGASEQALGSGTPRCTTLPVEGRSATLPAPSQGGRVTLTIELYACDEPRHSGDVRGP